MPSAAQQPTGNRAVRRGELRGPLLGAIEQLLDAGESYTELSVERIVAAAGVSRSTFYVYFEDKGDLLQSLTEELMGRLDELAHAIWDLAEDAGYADVRERMAALVATYREHRILMGAVVDSAVYDGRVGAAFGGVLEQAAGALAQHIRDGQAGGYVRSGLDPEPISAWLVWMTERGMYSLVREADDASLERHVDALTTVVWNTLYEGVRPAPRPEQEH
ncbi:MAG: TetR/AcrR family transcriptional regulator [Solirubrobacteraceae bacterium]|nr:TetR/AcrR family transcriptional regulator [Solirubrobacteraceae bacterium]